HTFEAQASEVSSVAFTPDGRTLLTVAEVGQYRCRQWDLATGRLVREFNQPHHTRPLRAITPDGRTVIAAGGDGIIHFWDITTGEPRPPGGAPAEPVRVIVFDPDGRTLWTAS